MLTKNLLKQDLCFKINDFKTINDEGLFVLSNFVIPKTHPSPTSPKPSPCFLKYSGLQFLKPVKTFQSRKIKLDRVGPWPWRL